MTTVLAWFGGVMLCAWAAVGLLIARLWWLNRQREREQARKHADVDALARRAKALSARSARVERWHDLPTVDEMGI